MNHSTPNPYEKLLIDLIKEMRQAQIEGNETRMMILQQISEETARRFNVYQLTKEISDKITEKMRGEK